MKHLFPVTKQSVRKSQNEINKKKNAHLIQTVQYQPVKQFDLDISSNEECRLAKTKGSVQDLSPIKQKLHFSDNTSEKNRKMTFPENQSPPRRPNQNSQFEAMKCEEARNYRKASHTNKEEVSNRNAPIAYAIRFRCATETH